MRFEHAAMHYKKGLSFPNYNPDLTHFARPILVDLVIKKNIILRSQTQIYLLILLDYAPYMENYSPLEGNERDVSQQQQSRHRSKRQRTNGSIYVFGIGGVMSLLNSYLL